MAEKKASKKTSKQLHKLNTYGSIVFGVGLAIALIAGLINIQSQTANLIVGATLVILGLAVGVLNITKEESVPFLIGSIVLVMLLQPFMSIVIQMFSIQSQTVVQMISGVFMNIGVFVVPAALVVALKVLFSTARDE